MLTTKVVRPGQAKHYYTKENYYTKEEANKHSLWSGRGAKVLGLNKGVDPEDFQKLVEGYLPNGEEFRAKRINRPGCKERSGLDCTFSAPKSVSIMALIKRDRQLEEAHRIAVKAALKVIEDRYTTTRVRQGSEQQVVWTNNLVVAQFDHDTNRELNPHLHTHCVLLNMTQLENGKWYALSNEKIHDNKKLLGQIYQNELAKQVQKLGYEIEQKGHGQFEIKRVTIKKR